MLKKYSMSIKAQSLNKNNDLNVSERYNDGFQNLSKSSSTIKVVIPNTNNQNKDIQFVNLEKQKRSSKTKIEINDDDESMFGETIKIENIQPITSIKFFPSKQQLVKQRLRTKALSKLKREHSKITIKTRENSVGEYLNKTKNIDQIIKFNPESNADLCNPSPSNPNSTLYKRPSTAFGFRGSNVNKQIINCSKIDT